MSGWVWGILGFSVGVLVANGVLLGLVLHWILSEEEAIEHGHRVRKGEHLPL